MKNAKSNGHLTPEQFVMRAIDTLRKEPYKGIHAVYSGFNAAFRVKFPKEDPIKFVQKMKEAKKVVVIPARGGVIIYKTKDAPKPKDNSGTNALKRMGL